MITTKRVFHGAPQVPLDKNVLVSVARSQSYRLILHHILKNFMLCIIRNIADKIYYSRKLRKLLKQYFTSFFFHVIPLNYCHSTSNSLISKLRPTTLITRFTNLISDSTPRSSKSATSSSNAGLAVGIVAVLLILVLMIVVAFFYSRRKSE